MTIAFTRKRSQVRTLCRPPSDGYWLSGLFPESLFVIGKES
ncbi:hypothetical protein [Aminobacterium mobile]